MDIGAATLGEGARIKPLTAAGIQDNVSAAHIEDVRDSVQQWFCHAEIVQPAACGDSFSGIAGIFRPPVVGLKKVDITGARDIEGMASRAENPALLASQGQMAVPDCAKKHPLSVNDRQANGRLPCAVWQKLTSTEAMPPAVVKEPATADYDANSDSRAAVVVGIITGVRGTITIRGVTVVTVTIAAVPIATVPVTAVAVTIVRIAKSETKTRIAPPVTAPKTVAPVTAITTAESIASAVAAITADPGTSAEASANTGTATGNGVTASSAAMSATTLCEAQRPKY
jgi:hypothetical protein